MRNRQSAQDSRSSTGTGTELPPRSLSRRRFSHSALWGFFSAMALVFIGRPAVGRENVRRAAGSGRLTTHVQAPVFTGRVELEADHAGEVPFGRVWGLAVTPTGGVFVVDWQAHRVYALSGEGQVLAVAGGQGDGPGELQSPFCPALAADRMLWVISNRRVDGFLLEWRADGRLAMVPGPRRPILGRFSYVVPAPVTPLPDGRMLVTVARNAGGRSWREEHEVFLELDLDGKVINEYALPERPPPESLGMIAARHVSGEEHPWFIPFSPELFVNRGADGSYVRVVTSRYDVIWHELDGSVRHRIVRDVQGTPLTKDDRAKAERQLAPFRRITARPGFTSPRIRVPATKPPIHSIWLDQDGRLWVRLYADDGPYARADVFDANGSLRFRARWPAGIDLGAGAVRGQTAWGVREGRLGEHFVVKIAFRRSQ